MPFLLIKGQYRPLAGKPDGDSLRFRADDPTLWSQLEGKPAIPDNGPTTKDTVQLRLEGIDAIEKTASPPLDMVARDNLRTRLGFDPATRPEPRGFILSRMTDDLSGRPISFVFSGAINKPDGSMVRLDPAMLRRSANYKQMNDGFAYPLYYNTLFADLRIEFNRALRRAKLGGRGYWPTDRTLQGVAIQGTTQLGTIPPIWPKLWRRLQDHLRGGGNLADFVDFLAAKNERIDILSIMEERGFQDVVRVQAGKVKLTEAPEDIRVRGKAGKRKA
jgi:hypothetical protein